MKDYITIEEYYTRDDEGFVVRKWRVAGEVEWQTELTPLQEIPYTHRFY